MGSNTAEGRQSQKNVSIFLSFYSCICTTKHIKTQTTHSALLNEQLDIQDYKIVYRQGQRSFKSYGRVTEYCKHINDCFREEYT